MDSTYDNGDKDANPESSNQMVQPNSFDQQKLRDEVSKMVDEKLADSRTTQSLKDKVWSDVKKQQDFREIFREIQTMKASGMTDKEIELEARIREVEKRESQVTDNNPGRAVPGDTTEVVKIFAQSLGLDQNDSEVVSAFSRKTIEEQVQSIANIANRRRNSVSPGVVAQSAGDGAKQPDLLEEYKAKAKNTFGNDLIELKMEYRRKGLEIY